MLDWGLAEGSAGNTERSHSVLSVSAWLVIEGQGIIFVFEKTVLYLAQELLFAQILGFKKKNSSSSWLLSRDHARASPFIPPAEKTAKQAHTCGAQTRINYIVTLALKFIAMQTLTSGGKVSLKGGFLRHVFYDVNGFILLFKLFPWHPGSYTLFMLRGTIYDVKWRWHSLLVV